MPIRIAISTPYQLNAVSILSRKIISIGEMESGLLQVFAFYFGFFAGT